MQHRKGYYYGRKIRNLKCAADYLAFFKSIPDDAWDGQWYNLAKPDLPCCAHGHLGRAYPKSFRRRDLALWSFEVDALGESVAYTSCHNGQGAQAKEHALAQYRKLVKLGY